MAKDKAREFEEALVAGRDSRYLLRLYVTGATSKSMRAIKNIREICEDHLKGRYELEVVDVYQQPGLAAEQDITAIPTLVKELPLPIRKLIGDLSDLNHVLVGLNLMPRDEGAERRDRA